MQKNDVNSNSSKDPEASGTETVGSAEATDEQDKCETPSAGAEEPKSPPLPSDEKPPSPQGEEEVVEPQPSPTDEVEEPKASLSDQDEQGKHSEAGKPTVSDIFDEPSIKLSSSSWSSSSPSHS